MNKTLKKTLSLFMSVVFILSFSVPAFSADISAKLYETYDDEMLFKQKEDFVLAGTADKGSKISAELKSASDKVIDSSEAFTADDGIFNVTLKAPNGSFEEYTITLFENGKEFDKLENVVFGEVWLASGQSNMDLQLGISTLGQEMQKKGERLSKWIRFLSVPFAPEYKGDGNNVPYLPLDDIKGCNWFSGDSDLIYGFSATAFFFAEKLFQTINMPLGVIQSSVGGSTIRSWLPREGIDNSDVKDILKRRDLYITKNKWKENEINFPSDMTANYNKKVHPLKNFRLSGMIWYQGESDIGSDYGQYSAQLGLLQDTYSKLFKYNGKLPLIFTQLASFSYSDFMLQKLNMEFSDFQQADPASRAVTTIYDVPLTYSANIHAIHPLEKHQVGRRMAFCAEGLVYNKHDTYTTATPDTVEIKENSIVVKFKNTGDGLIKNGDTLSGFAVCGSDGIYLPAEAEIISKDTIKIYSNQITNPVSASYAVSQMNARSNLCAYVDTYTFPVSPFITDRKYSENLWIDNGWSDCDTQKIWRTHSNELTGFYDTWKAENAKVEITANSAYSGNGGLSVKSDKNNFSVNPLTTYQNGEVMHDLDTDFTKYGTISFKVKNNGKEDVKFTQLEIVCEKTKVSPKIVNSKSFSSTIPADGEWHTVTLNLGKIYITDFPLLPALNTSLKQANALNLRFENSNGEISDLSIDNFEFSAKEPPKNIFVLIKEFFVKIFNSLISLF